MVSSKCLVSCVQVYNGVNPLYICVRCSLCTDVKVFSVCRCVRCSCVQMCKVFLCTDVYLRCSCVQIISKVFLCADV